MRLRVQEILFTYQAVGEDSDGRYALTEGIVPPHHGAPEHVHHRGDEKFYIFEGEFGTERVGGYAKRLRARLRSGRESSAPDLMGSGRVLQPLLRMPNRACATNAAG